MEINKLDALIIHVIGFDQKNSGIKLEEIIKKVESKMGAYLTGTDFDGSELKKEIKQRINNLEKGTNEYFGQIIKQDGNKFYSFCEPNKESIDFWLSKYGINGYNDGYFNRDKFVEQEKAVRKAFECEDFTNNDIENIIIKATLINSLYSTSILDLYPICKGICDTNIYKKIDSGDASVVYDIATIKKEVAEKSRINISFASKYCHHCNPDKFPIYDRYVVDMLLYFYNKDEKFGEYLNGEEIAFKKNGQKTKNENNEEIINKEHYGQFVKLYNAFKEYYAKDENGNALNYSLRKWDEYLWIVGKHLFYDISRLKEKSKKKNKNNK